jgi:hypothetical protein
MPHNETKGLAGWWHNLRERATQAVADQEVAFARGKVAGVAVTDDAGQLLVDAGQRIDEAVIARAKQAGKIAALAAAAVAAQKQDLKENIQAHRARTESGQEALYLGSVEEYREARTYLGRTLTMDVTDIRGNVVVASGKTLDDEDIRRARDAGLLSALLVVAEQALPPAPNANTTSPAPPPISSASPLPTKAPRPAPILLNGPEE